MCKTEKPTDIEEQLTSSIHWLLNELKQTSYGTVGLEVVVHDSKISRIEKKIVEKLRP